MNNRLRREGDLSVAKGLLKGSSLCLTHVAVLISKKRLIGDALGLTILNMVLVVVPGSQNC